MTGDDRNEWGWWYNGTLYWNNIEIDGYSATIVMNPAKHLAAVILFGSAGCSGTGDQLGYNVNTYVLGR
jgi:hypothetical protein